MARFLRALGLTRSCELRVCQNGEPCIVQVRSTRIGLSRDVARQIYVLPIPERGL
jgi:Fe2+ transport system protein FeoA